MTNMTQCWVTKTGVIQSITSLYLKGLVERHPNMYRIPCEYDPKFPVVNKYGAISIKLHFNEFTFDHIWVKPREVYCPHRFIKNSIRADLYNILDLLYRATVTNSNFIFKYVKELDYER